jgi:hypothetical protein
MISCDVKGLIYEAGFRAVAEQADDRQNVMVLMPSCWGEVALNQGWPIGIWPRFSDVHSSLRSLPIETLIIVGGGHDGAGVMLAQDRLRAQVQPRLVTILPGVAQKELNGDACFADDALSEVVWWWHERQNHGEKS